MTRRLQRLQPKASSETAHCVPKPSLHTHLLLANCSGTALLQSLHKMRRRSAPDRHQNMGIQASECCLSLVSLGGYLEELRTLRVADAVIDAENAASRTNSQRHATSTRRRTEQHPLHRRLHTAPPAPPSACHCPAPATPRIISDYGLCDLFSPERAGTPAALRGRHHPCHLHIASRLSLW